MADPVFPRQIRETFPQQIREIRELLDRLESLCEDARRLREQINDVLKRERVVHRTLDESESKKPESKESHPTGGEVCSFDRQAPAKIARASRSNRS